MDNEVEKEETDVFIYMKTTIPGLTQLSQRYSFSPTDFKEQFKHWAHLSD